MADDTSPDNKTSHEEVVAEAVYEPSTAQVDAERRAEGGEFNEAKVADHLVSVNPSYGVEEGFGFIGTDQIYQNGADDRQLPHHDDDDWQRKLMVEPADDAGKVMLPSVPGTRPGGPSVEVDDQENKSTKAMSTKAPARKSTPPGAK